MDRLKVGAVQLEYEVHGSGEPVLLIHGAHIADAMLPLVEEPALDGYRLIRYHRRGFVGSDHPSGPTSIGQQAADAAGVLDRLGVDRTHAVGHSLGALIALELAAGHPSRVLSLSLLEPAVLTGPAGAIFSERVAPLAELYRNGDPTAAVDGFVALAAGADWQETVEACVPGSVAAGARRRNHLLRARAPSSRRVDLRTRPSSRHHLPGPFGARHRHLPAVRRRTPAPTQLVR